jgi:hypothetical protein
MSLEGSPLGSSNVDSGVMLQEWLSTPLALDSDFPVGEYVAVPGMGTLAMVNNTLYKAICRVMGHNGAGPYAELWFGWEVVGVTGSTPTVLAGPSDYNSALITGGADAGAGEPSVDALSPEVSTFGVNVASGYDSYKLQPVAKISAFNAGFPPVITYAYLALGLAFPS